MAVLDVRHLQVNIQTRAETYHVLRDVSFRIEQRALLGLVGESGCGKSMTAAAILRMLPKNANVTGGEVLLDEADLVRMSESEMRRVRGRDICMIFQNAALSLNPLLTALEHVADVYVRHSGVSKKEARSRATELLGTTGIGVEHCNSYPHELSGGMCQRVMITMALACSPSILIVDEPTTGLDVTIQNQVIELIEESVRKLSASLILISHDIGLVSEVCAQIAVMYVGRIVEVGSAEHIISDPAHPYTVGLLRSFLDRTGARMPFIPGRVPDLRIVKPGCSFAPRCELATNTCHSVMPQMQEIESGHLAACHNWVAQ